MNLMGMVLDQHDDPKLSVLRGIFGEQELPSMIKEARFLEEQHLNALPNDAFALCAVDNGNLIRKFATVDPGMTSVSVLYFQRTKDQLPLVAQKVAAANLVESCLFHNIEPPADIVKLASGIQPQALIDISGLQPIIKMAAPGTGVILDSMEKTAAACDYFDESFKMMHPSERHRFAVKLLKTAQAQGVTPSEKLERYGSETYAPSLKMAYQIRKDHLNDEDAVGVLDALFSKTAEVAPDKFVEALAEFDRSFSLDQYWDKGVPDPWFSTFGTIKVAEYVYVDGNDRVTATDLKRLAQNPLLLNEHFESSIVSAFKSNPVTIFDSLPLPQKKVLMRIASDSGTGGANFRSGGA